MCFAIQGPFAGQAPFWAISSETLPRGLVGMVIGLVNAAGNLGGYVGPFFAGWLVKGREGFIEQEEPGPDRQRAGQGHPLAFATAERAG